MARQVKQYILNVSFQFIYKCSEKYKNEAIASLEFYLTFIPPSTLSFLFS